MGLKMAHMLGSAVDEHRAQLVEVPRGDWLRADVRDVAVGADVQQDDLTLFGELAEEGEVRSHVAQAAGGDSVEMLPSESMQVALLSHKRITGRLTCM